MSFVLFSIVCYFLFNTSISENVKYSDSYIVHFRGEANSLADIVSNYGYTIEKEILQHYFKIKKQKNTRNLPSEEINLYSLQEKNTKIDAFFQEEYLQRQKKTKKLKRQQQTINVTDSFWIKQWYLDPEHEPNMGVYDSWNKGLTGNGIFIAIVDDGIDPDHIDLVSNYNATLSTNIIRDTDDPSHMYSSEGHGTNCAGIASAVKNDDCVIGVAYDATFGAIRLLDGFKDATASDEASALTFRLDAIDIYSNSWGPVDDGIGFDSSDRLSELQQKALIQGVTIGRRGKGAIYVWAAGNGGENSDDCNVDGYSNSMYTISISAVRPDGAPAYYSEECTAIMAVTYGGDEYYDEIATTDPGDKCIENFQGTSAACPVAAGIIALVLQANPDLSWRDVQHLIVVTSITTSLPNANFYTNRAGKKVSLSHGFGLMNAQAMVDEASSWKTVPQRIRCDSPTFNSTSSSFGKTSLTDSYRADDCFIGYLEHVLLTVKYNALWREHTSIYLKSPSGTESRILRERRRDSQISDIQWTFMTLHTWGENPVGTWTIRFDSTRNSNRIILYSWKLEFYGTVSYPLDGIQNDGFVGGICNDTVPCIGQDAFCLKTEQLCINCSRNYHVIGDSCIRDGINSGFCDESVKCIDINNGCNSTSNRCVICSTGYHVIDGFCMEDGKIGGYCGADVKCIENGTGCNESSTRCVNCTSGYHIIGNYCKQDGILDGFCDSKTLCTQTGIGCNGSQCINCRSGYHIINGFCFKDGTLGGYCNSTVHCVDASVGCKNDYCINCTEGFHVINYFCKQDGKLGGYCNSTLSCTEDETGCDKSSEVCIVCFENHHVVQTFCIEDGTLGGYCNESTRCKVDSSQCVNNLCEEFRNEKEQEYKTYAIVGVIFGLVGLGAFGGVAVLLIKRWNTIKIRSQEK